MGSPAGSVADALRQQRWILIGSFGVWRDRRFTSWLSRFFFFSSCSSFQTSTSSFQDVNGILKKIKIKINLLGCKPLFGTNKWRLFANIATQHERLAHWVLSEELCTLSFYFLIVYNYHSFWIPLKFLCLGECTVAVRYQALGSLFSIKSYFSTLTETWFLLNHQTQFAYFSNASRI